MNKNFVIGGLLIVIAVCGTYIATTSLTKTLIDTSVTSASHETVVSATTTADAKVPSEVTSSKVAPEIPAGAVTPNAQASVEIKKVAYEIFAPGDEKQIPGSGDIKYRDELVLTNNGKSVTLFGSDHVVTILDYKFSPSNKYLYVLTGQVSQDSAVTPYIISMQTNIPECLRASGLDCNRNTSYSYPESFSTVWRNDDRISISYNNRSLAAGASESGPSIGMQHFQSVAGQDPWFITAVK